MKNRQTLFTGVYFRTLFVILISLVLTMCKEHEELINLDNKANIIATRNHHDKLKREFGKALARVLFEDKGVRNLIREEALKKFNNDYEVLYHMIKDRPVSDSRTFRQTLLAYSGNESLFEEIEKEMPLLTLLVPELPENSFSAMSWDVESQLPVVGLRIWSTEGVPILVGNGQEFTLPFDYIPGFPVIVVKDNERVTTTQSAGYNTFKAPNTNFYYQFTDANFNNLNGRGTNSHSAARISFSMDQKLIDARNIMDPVDGWQRDHIYYNLTPSNPKGPFRLDFKEKITSFTFNYGQEAYNKIAEQSGDPRVGGTKITNSSTLPAGAAAWTDGSFEFSVNALVNSKATGLPATNPRFPANGYDLFEVAYQLSIYAPCNWYQGCIGDDIYIYTVKSVTPKTYYPKDVDLINWDLDRFAPTMIITIKEQDLPQSETTKETSSTEFAGNFQVDQADGIFKKIGLKFGASGKKVFSSERTVVTILDSDDLGNTTVEFGDKVIIAEATISLPILGNTKYYRTREYSTGMVSFSIEPAFVQ